MPVVNVEDLVRLHRKPEDIRNICILAHVDHGKTSLTDSLIATNGIISPKLAGKIRYLDSRPDEQLRGITMESSAISLFFSMLRRPNPEAAPVPKEYLINLIDSPGHIDFSSEVSTASRLCDGAIVLVDAVEGVCSQTVTVLRQSWVEQLKPILVINKMDRLVSELQMSPSEAYAHLSRLLEQVNAVIGSFYQGERMEEDLQWRERMEDRINASAAEKSKKQSQGDASSTADSGIDAAEFEEIDDEDLYFAPEKNNVIFCSAVDGWAFTIRQFAAIYERKIGIKRSVLEKVLWGDFYLDPKTKRVLGQKHLKGRSLKPMFVQLVLDSVWAAYEATTGGGKGKGDPALLEKITKSLNITIPPYILRSRDPKNIMTTLFSMWLPLSTAVLVSVIEYLPSPPSAQATRLPDMIEGSPGSNFVDSKVKDAMSGFKTGKEEPVVAYVSKMVAIPESELTSSKKRSGTTMTADEAREIARRKREEIAKMQEAANGGGSSGQEKDDYARITSSFDLVTIDDNADQQPENAEDKADPEHLIGFARLYSGTLSVGDTVYVLGPKFTPANPHAKPEPHRVTITDLYLLMGKSLEPLQSVPAGVVFGIGGLAGHVLKNGTLCSQLSGSVNLAGVSLATPPIVRVSLEPANPADLSKMVTGLRLLEQSDPCAQFEVLPNGEHVMLTAGELHLERCLKDLRERFARCDIQTGQTIVPYRETTVTAPEMAPPKNPDLGRGAVQLVSSSKQLTVRLRVVPLPAPVTEFFTKQVGTIKQLQLEKHSVKPDEEKEDEEESETGDVSHEAQESTGSVLSLEAFRTELTRIFDEEVPDKEVWKNVVDQITAFGPRRIGPNILVDATAVNTCEKFLINDPKQQPSIPSQAEGGNRQALIVRDFCDKIAYAFQLATAQGPLCQEPIQGTAVFLEELAANDDAGELDLGRLTGEAIKLVRESISQGFLDWSPRVMLAMYSCEIQASTEVLGRVYGVITRRRGRILSEAMKEGTPFFTILSLLPVAESFGFAEEIRKRTSGAAQPQLIFAGFEALDEDPFWVPATEEELEDLGELADRENLAKRYMDAVRARKGLVVQGRKLIDAEKQKTLKK